MLPLLNWPYAPNCYSIFIIIYDLLQLQFKTHSVLLRLGAQGWASRFFWQLPSATTGAASASNRATTGGLPLSNTIYPQPRPLAATAGDCVAGELISHQAQPVSNRESLWVPQEINPPWGPLRLGPGTGLLRRIQDRTSSSKHQCTPDRSLFRPCQSFHQLS